jgi:hypothetical protein
LRPAGDHDQATLEQRLRQLQSRASGIHPYFAASGRLGSMRSRLDADPQFDVLHHVGWQQPSEPLPAAKLVEISEPGVGISPDLLGYVRIYTARALIYADVVFRYTPFSYDDAEASRAIGSTGRNLSGDDLIHPEPRYYIDEKRRIRFGELHYLDHPRFGVVLTVNRSPGEARETGAPAAETAPQDDSTSRTDD